MSDIAAMQEKCTEKQVEYDMLPKQILQVKFEMSAPFSTIDYLRIDGILAFFSLKELLGQDFFNLAGTAVDPVIDAPLPIEKGRTSKGLWWWHASFGLNSLHRDQITRWKKRWDDEHDDLVKFDGKKARVDHKAGFFKAYDMPLVLKNAAEVLFCVHGNMAEVERLLRGCKFVGKKRSQGYGEIKRISIEETQHDWSCWFVDNNDRGADNRPSRAIPMDMETFNGGSAKFREMAYKPPYWHPANNAWCYSM
jgi:CRISPR type IV-associated protein Csf3